jgi:hypothetical protein
VEGQTVTKAVVTLEDLELTDESGRSVVLLPGSVSVDLVAFQNDLDQVIQRQGIEAGRFTQLRFRLTSAWIESIDAQSVTHVLASEGVDLSQLRSVASVGRLELAGINSLGFCEVALPGSGIGLQGDAILALHFALANGLSIQSNDVWVFQPRVCAVDAPDAGGPPPAVDAGGLPPRHPPVHGSV